VTSYLNEDFLACFARLPEHVRQQARKVYELWKDDPRHPSLSFKRVHTSESVYSVRVGLGWRALGLVEEDSVTWFWIGSHADYDKLLAQL
jgi:hypothetical protein